jgi:hypothetical protein
LKPDSEFHKATYRKRGFNIYCKTCVKEKRDPELAKRLYKQYCLNGGRRKAKYGVSNKEFESVYKAQGGKCAVCREPVPMKGKNCCIDHCHGTKMFRGLLCRHCNLAEGHIKTPKNALRLYQYMLKNELFYQGAN